MAMSNSHYLETDFCLILGSGGQTLQQLLFFLRSKDVSYLTLSSSRIVNLKSSLHKGAKNLSSGPLLSFVNGAWVHRFLI
ncbi:hypothetical protein TIFTF001_026741 [Ficus carica]|uniref:Uncharacterized protein n=1 Tax=Ficus carica TaxID=3494 RepID=A0AA88DLU3_FICCA|nr:hypothetical protein TIFTF001_026741 [Ficus carica]